MLDERDGVLGLPMIVNKKTVDPGDKSSPAVYQLETAMGAAIDVFEGAAAIEVPRARFAPVKTTNDLLVVRSDAYELTEDAELRLVRDEPPLFVDLDSDHYKLVRDFDARFPKGVPSLKDCDRLAVNGDVRFGARRRRTRLGDDRGRPGDPRRRGARGLSPQSSVLSPQFSVLSSQFSVLSSQFSVLSSQFSVLSSQFSVLSSQFSVLSSQFSVLSSQFSVLSSQFSVLSPQSSVLSPQSSVLSPQSSVLS